MNCPHCRKSTVRRSPRRGFYEGFVLRISHKAPYRCEFCRLRFVASEDPQCGVVVARPRSLLRYLGLADTLSLQTFIALGLATLLMALIAVGVGLMFHESSSFGSGL